MNKYIWKNYAVKNGQTCPLEEKVFTVPFVLCKLDFFLFPPKVSWKPTIQECWLVDGRRKGQIKVSFRWKRWFARKCCLPGQGGAGLAKSNMMWGRLVSRDCHPIKITHSHVVAKGWNKTFSNTQDFYLAHSEPLLSFCHQSTWWAIMSWCHGINVTWYQLFSSSVCASSNLFWLKNFLF